MPRYLIPDSDGICRRASAYRAPHEVPDGTLKAEPVQTYPCRADGSPVTEQELADIAEAQELARQASKPDEVKLRENEYLAICENLGLTQAATREDGLDTLLYNLGKSQTSIAGYHEVNAAALRLQNLATKIDVDDIPEGGHDMGV